MDKSLIMSSLLSGLIGSLITLVSTNYMVITKDRKTNAIKMIELINSNVLELEKITQNKECTREEIDRLYNEFMKREGALNSIANFYFSENIKKYTKSFVAHCDAVYLILEMKLNLEDLLKVDEGIAFEQKEILKLESLEEDINEDYVTVEKLKQIIAEKSEISEKKMKLKIMKQKNEMLNIRIIENKYRIRKIFASDNVEDVFKETKKYEGFLVAKLSEETKFSNRLIEFLNKIVLLK